MLMLPDIQEALKGHCNGHDTSAEIQQDEAEKDEGVLLSEYVCLCILHVAGVVASLSL